MRDYHAELEAVAADLEHGADYQRARQQYLRTLAADPTQPVHVRGWVANQLRRLARGQASALRGPPGYDVGHKLGKHGQHDPRNFRMELARDNRRRPSVSRRARLFHKYRESEAPGAPRWFPPWNTAVPSTAAKSRDDGAEAMATLPRPYRLRPARLTAMVAAVRQLDDPAFAGPLTRAQRWALLANLVQILRNNVPRVRQGLADPRSLLSQASRPRWRFLRQFPAARARFLAGLRSAGVQPPLGI